MTELPSKASSSVGDIVGSPVPPTKVVVEGEIVLEAAMVSAAMVLRFKATGHLKAAERPDS